MHDKINRAAMSSKDAIAGGVAGFGARALSAPFDLLKIRFQLQSVHSSHYTSIASAVRSIIKHEGFWSLWKGNVSATLLWTTYGATQFWIFGHTKSFLKALTDSLGINTEANKQFCELTIDGVAGAFACAASTTLSYPFDLSRTQFASQGTIKVHSHIYSFMQRTINETGIRGIYSGFGAALVGVVPYMGINFALNGYFRRLLDNKNLFYLTSAHDDSNYSILSSAISGALSGGISKLLVYPLDTLKRRFQARVIDTSFEQRVNHHTLRKRYPSLAEGIKDIFVNEGLKGFYRGVVPSIWKALIATSLNFTIYEIVKARLD